jgi:hypothetical protein
MPQGWAGGKRRLKEKIRNSKFERFEGGGFEQKGAKGSKGSKGSGFVPLARGYAGTREDPSGLPGLFNGDWNGHDGVVSGIRMRVGVLYWLCVLAAGSAFCADETKVDEYADRYFKEWSAETEMGDAGPAFDTMAFSHEVPPVLRADVLDGILKRVALTKNPRRYAMATYSALRCVEEFVNATPPIEVSDGLDADLVTLLKSRDSRVRVAVLNIYRELKREKDEALVADRLNDFNDEVRAAAVDALRGRDGVEVILRKYIKEHETDLEYTTSVREARDGVKAKQGNGG